jgi:seryl-tRNA synthetase
MDLAMISGTHQRPHPLLEGLLGHGLLLQTSVTGLWGRGERFERVVSGIERAIDEITISDGAQRLRFPPVVSRRDFERSGFLKSFPHLAGSVHAFQGDHARHQELLARLEAGQSWSECVSMTDVVLTPAACYPVYPALSGALPSGGTLSDVSSYCFRHEPSTDPARMIAFRMREQVRTGSPAEVLEFRERWLKRAERLFELLSVRAASAPASDPFFGRGGRFLAIAQKEQELKFELLAPILSEQEPTAIMSFNYHQDHFGRAFEIRTSDGALAHTACVGFGLERVALALFRCHGFEPECWPVSVRSLLHL